MKTEITEIALDQLGFENKSHFGKKSKMIRKSLNLGCDIFLQVEFHYKINGSINSWLATGFKIFLVDDGHELWLIFWTMEEIEALINLLKGKIA